MERKEHEGKIEKKGGSLMRTEIWRGYEIERNEKWNGCRGRCVKSGGKRSKGERMVG